jgi:hypothetical protein
MLAERLHPEPIPSLTETTLHGKEAQTGTMAVQRSGKRVQDFPGERAGRMNVGR